MKQPKYVIDSQGNLQRDGINTFCPFRPPFVVQGMAGPQLQHFPCGKNCALFDVASGPVKSEAKVTLRCGTQPTVYVAEIAKQDEKASPLSIVKVN